mmetsp:Transcript_32357/g.39813  ORF Transcript_32357/g.39813 Transcript_32357/m.39813 type:complete len:373 (+) Transcript_32357:195-1313(+)
MATGVSTVWSSHDSSLLQSHTSPYRSQVLAPGLVLYSNVQLSLNDNIEIRYEISNDSEHGRETDFNINFSGSENVILCFEQGKDERVGEGQIGRIKPIRKTIKPGTERLLIGLLEVVDDRNPWTVEAKYTWVEKRMVEKNLTQNMSMKIIDRLLQGRTLAAIEYLLVFRSPEPSKIVFDIDFSKSSNIELKSGGLKKRTLIDSDNVEHIQIAYLQVLDLQKPWDLKCSYEWREEVSKPHGSFADESVLSPNVVLITSRVEEANVDAFRYEIVSSKNNDIDFLFDCSQCENMRLMSTCDLCTGVSVKAWEHKYVDTIMVVDPKKSWKLKPKFSWNEFDLKQTWVFGKSTALSCGNDSTDLTMSDPASKVNVFR